MMSRFNGPLGIWGLKEMKLQTDWHTSVLNRTGILDWLQNPQSTGSDRSTETCRDRHNAPGGQNTAPSSLHGTRNGTLSIELSHCQSLTYHRQRSIACLRFAHPMGTSPGTTRNLHMMMPNSTALAARGRLQCTWCTAVKQLDFSANGHYDHPFCHLTCQTALNISRALWRNQLTSRNFSKSRSSTPESVPASGHRCYSELGAARCRPRGSFFYRFSSILFVILHSFLYQTGSQPRPFATY